MPRLSHPNFNDHSVVLRPVIGTQPATEFEKTLAQAPLCRVEAKEFLFAEGDTSTHLYRIETGALALHKTLADGRRQVMGFAYPGDLIGLGDGRALNECAGYQAHTSALPASLDATPVGRSGSDARLQTI
jgi:CRP-like cAMP-binding protein